MPDTSKQKGDTVTDSRLNVDAQRSGRAGAAQPQGAEALLGALQNNHSGMDISSVLDAVLGGAGGDLLSSLLDQDGDGKLGLGDALKIGSSLFGEKR